MSVQDPVDPVLVHTHVDGPGFCAWLFEVEPDLAHNRVLMLGAATTRRVLERQDGTPCTSEYADRICCLFARHIDEIPVGLWMTPRWPNPTMDRVLDLLGKGFRPAEVARMVGVAHSTVSRYKQRSRDMEHGNA